MNSAIVAYFIEDLHINRHFDLFKKLLFMEDGEFSLSLSNQLFEKVRNNYPATKTAQSRVQSPRIGDWTVDAPEEIYNQRARNNFRSLRSLLVDDSKS